MAISANEDTNGVDTELKTEMNNMDTDSDSTDPLDPTGEEDWEDMEPDEETVTVVSLFDEKAFGNVPSMLSYCRDEFDFDFMKVRADLGLDFFDTVKLINYIRHEVLQGNKHPAISKAAFEDDKFLKPVLQDDALLYSFDDVDQETNENAAEGGHEFPLSLKVQELQETLETIRLQFAQYKEEVQKTILSQLQDDDSTASRNGSMTKEMDVGDRTKSRPKPDDFAKEKAKEDAEKHDENYFSSYAWNGIHETMLKDTIRTDAYRDFIYDNKHLFRDKVVLDVGCGTGILSMFCAKAGAKMVIAVDNSDIIDKARQIVFDNGLEDVVKCLRGKIEEVTLPVSQVDVIVSEWMGYCLLFEAMFDSVIWARDHYLADTGLMVPSHAALRLAPVSDSDLIDSHITFWSSVYGFNMSRMLEEAYDQALIDTTTSESLAADSFPFLRLDLHETSVEDLSFNKPFSIALTRDIDCLDAWTVWFDMFFAPSRDFKLPDNALPRDMQKNGLVAFTTGPDGAPTHWKQGILLADRRVKKAEPLKRGSAITGHVEYKKSNPKARFLNIRVQWSANEGNETGDQCWCIE